MRTLLSIIIVALLAGCTFTMVGNAPKTEVSQVHNETINATYARSEQFINACTGDDEELAEMRFHTNAVYLAISLLSLGLYVPQNITWWCTAETTECEEGDTSSDCEPYVPEDD